MKMCEGNSSGALTTICQYERKIKLNPWLVAFDLCAMKTKDSIDSFNKKLNYFEIQFRFNNNCSLHRLNYPIELPAQINRNEIIRSPVDSIHVNIKYGK